MRGSPLLRTLMVIIGLTLTGMGLATLAKDRQASSAPKVEAEAEAAARIDTPFVLTLSAEPKEITLESGGETRRFESDTRILTGAFALEAGHPAVFITVKWSDPEPSPRFAKLVLEPSGLPTMSRVFDAQGELSDVWELHLHHHDEHE